MAQNTGSTARPAVGEERLSRWDLDDAKVASAECLNEPASSRQGLTSHGPRHGQTRSDNAPDGRAAGSGAHRTSSTCSDPNNSTGLLTPVALLTRRRRGPRKPMNATLRDVVPPDCG